uniref:EGF-like domain-containing protein n=1 Tax=Arion vulgaris TaxID=1028688 RepID=A0A0B7A1B8_9EUPU
MEISRGTYVLLLAFFVYWCCGLSNTATNSTVVTDGSNSTVVTTGNNTENSSSTTTLPPAANNTELNTTNVTESTNSTINSTSSVNSTNVSSGVDNSTQTNETTTTMPNDTSTVAPTTAAPTTPAPTTAQPVKVINYCESNPCVHGNCLNYPSTYACDCGTDWTGVNCETKLVLFPGYKFDGSTESSQILYPDIPFPYFERSSPALFAESNGYVSFGAQFNMTNAPIGTDWPFAPSLFAVYWANSEVGNNNRSFFNIMEDQTRLLINSNGNTSAKLYDYMKNIINESNFEPLYIVVLTYQNVMPSPAANFSKDVASFQLILATDSKFSYAIKNYQTVWKNTESFGRPSVSTDYSGANGMRIKGDTPMDTTEGLLVKLFSSGTPTKDPFVCVEMTRDVHVHLGNDIMKLPTCPCYMVQASTEGWFTKINDASSCYQSIITISGLKQQCCYNSFGLLFTKSKEAKVPIEVGVSNGTLQSVFDQCCVTVPQLFLVLSTNYNILLQQLLSAFNC